LKLISSFNYKPYNHTNRKKTIIIMQRFNFLIAFFIYFFISSGFWVSAQIESDLDYDAIAAPPEEKIIQEWAVPVGTYDNFNTFKSKIANEAIKYTVRQRREFWGYSYQLLIEGTKKRENKAYAYSDGEAIYLNARNFRAGNYFVRIESYGKYHFFRSWVQRSGFNIGLGVGVGVGPMGVGNGNNGALQGLVLNTENGEIIILTPKKMKMLLSSQPELLKAYSGEKNRRQLDIIESYIVALNNATANR
jgi:hypothetical protein